MSSIVFKLERNRLATLVEIDDSNRECKCLHQKGRDFPRAASAGRLQVTCSVVGYRRELSLYHVFTPNWPWYNRMLSCSALHLH